MNSQIIISYTEFNAGFRGHITDLFMSSIAVGDFIIQQLFDFKMRFPDFQSQAHTIISYWSFRFIARDILFNSHFAIGGTTLTAYSFDHPSNS